MVKAWQGEDAMFMYDPFDASPWRVLDEMMDSDRRLNRVLQATADRVSGRYPRVNVYTDDNGALMDVELPGVLSENVEVSVDGNTVAIQGTWSDERSAGRRFERRFELPFTIAADAVGAKFGRGLLRVTLPKSPAAKPRRIMIDKG